MRPLASDYGVVHTTLLDYFRRPEVAREIKEAERQLRAARRVAAERRAAAGRLEREVRRQAKQQAARERDDQRGARAGLAEPTSRRRPPRDDYEAWLDERDQRRPLSRADLHSANDKKAAQVVGSGGGIEAVIAVTGLRSLENVVRLIDPAILKEAYDNDLLRQAQAPAG